MGVVLKVEGNVYDLKGWSGVVVIICTTWIVLVLSEVQKMEVLPNPKVWSAI